MQSPFSLAGKTILVTGASSGIGRATAIACAQMGAGVLLMGRNEQRLSETLNSMAPGNHRIIQADLTADGGMDFIKELPALNGLVHAAGISKRLPLKFIRPSELDTIHETNFLAPVELTRLLYKEKKLAAEASLVYISSVAANYASLGHIMYMSSKAALNAFVKGVALELAGSGIRANAVLPGMVNTPLSPVLSDEMKQKDLANYPLGRYGEPEEIALAAVYLLSDATQWMTGTFLTLDGGLTLSH